MSERVIRGVEAVSVNPRQAWMVGLEPTSSVPAEDDEYFVPIPEPFTSDDLVYAWTEDALHRMDKLGIVFPVSVSLCGPVMLPSKENFSDLIPVWYSTGFDWKGGWTIGGSVVRIVDEFMDGTLADEVLSFEDRRFLAAHYRPWSGNGSRYYLDEVHVRLWEGVKEGSNV